MHTTLSELLENLKQGLLWVNREGVVRYANTDAVARTGLATGRTLYDPDLRRAVVEAVTHGAVRQVKAMGVAAQPGEAIPELACRVLPGLARDDAFVMIAADPSADAGTAYDNLMQVIRSDLRDPLRQAHQAVALARQGGDQHAIDALADQVEGLLKEIDKLVDLAALWGSGALFASDRIELWPLLQEVWAEVEPLALSRSLRVRFHTPQGAGSMATLYGSATWLRRVFQECLDSAVRTAPRGATVDIEHRQMGPRALIVFRDSGMFAPRLEGATVMTSGKPAAGAPPQQAVREAIGLKLCQHIVALHGGQLREEAEDGVRDFLIDLPTGAPFRADTTQLDIAQAQHYAKDLAALMARARDRKQSGAAPAA
jgi:signal transduction histidine kinase